VRLTSRLPKQYSYLLRFSLSAITSVGFARLVMNKAKKVGRRLPRV